MLTKEDILSIVRSGEGYNAEFKSRVPSKLKELSEEICAFANAAGGVLLLGVDDNSTIIGAAIENSKLSSIQNSLNEINALAHRDYYDKGAKITIELFDDRVEISNPGGLTSAITPSEFGTKSHSRNPLIFGLFVRIDLVEQVGSGIGRMRNVMAVAALPEPEFKMDGMFTVVFNRSESSGKSSGKSSGADWKKVKLRIQQNSETKLGKSALKILEMVYHSSDVTIPEMAASIKITERAIEKNIQKLKEFDLLERKEGKKGGFWKLKIEID